MRHHSVEVQVPAKINLQLAVGPLESDGYHQLVTVFQAISLYDSVKISRDADEFSISITGDYANAVPADENNLIYKAIVLMAEKHSSQKNVLVEVKKNIPVAGGMAGGSADAAATILAVDQLFELNLSREEMAECAAQLGADVPFMLNGGTAVGRGRGDEITPALSRGTYHWVIAVSSTGLSTPAVYGECGGYMALGAGLIEIGRAHV